MPPILNFEAGGSDAGDPIEREAADWFAMRYQGLTPAQKTEFESWLESDPRHAEIFQEMEETWSLLEPSPCRSVPEGAVKPKFTRTWIPIALATAAAIASALVLWRGPQIRSRNFSEVVVSDVGTLRQIELPDHSLLQLSAGSAVEIQFTSHERRIVLSRGEANFLVSKNSAWPFVVRAGAVEICAVGTAFDVLLRSKSVDLLVTQGKVRVTDTRNGGSLLAGGVNAEPLLLAGQYVQIALKNARELPRVVPEALSAAKIRDLLAWKEKRLVFHEESMADIVAKFNRFNRHRLVIGSPELADRRFGGAYPAADYRAFVKSLEENYGIIGDEHSVGETVLKLVAPTATAGASVPSATPSAEKYLVFRFDRLTDIVASFNRYNRHKLVIDGADLANQRFGGTFPARDYEAFIRLLRNNFNVIVVERGDETILRTGPLSEALDKIP